MPAYPYYQPAMQPVYQPMYPGQQPPMMDNLAQLRQQGQMQSMQAQQPMLLGRAVSDVAEARAVPSDLNGQPMFFPDLSHNAIHMKIFNPQTGAGDFYTFNLAQPAQAEAKPMQRPAAAQQRYALAEDVDALRSEISTIRSDMAQMISAMRASGNAEDGAHV